MKKIYGIVHDAIRKGIESEGKVVLNQDGMQNFWKKRFCKARDECSIAECRMKKRVHEILFG